MSSDDTIRHVATVFPVDSEAVKSNYRQARTRSIIREFSSNTTAHGIPGIARSRSWPNRLFWTISTLTFLGIMLFFCIKVVINYFGYPTTADIEIETSYRVAFPAVSFCNFSPTRLDELYKAFVQETNVDIVLGIVV